jgi:hypothetical protein
MVGWSFAALPDVNSVLRPSELPFSSGPIPAFWGFGQTRGLQSREQSIGPR